MNIDVTADCAKQTRETETSGNMTNRNSLLGRSKPGQRLARFGRCKVVLVLGGG